MDNRSVFIVVALAVMMGCAVFVMHTVPTVRGQNVTTPSGAVLVPDDKCKVGYYSPYLNGHWTGQCIKMK